MSISTGGAEASRSLSAKLHTRAPIDRSHRPLSFSTYSLVSFVLFLWLSSLFYWFLSLIPSLQKHAYVPLHFPTLGFGYWYYQSLSLLIPMEWCFAKYNSISDLLFFRKAINMSAGAIGEIFLLAPISLTVSNVKTKVSLKKEMMNISGCNIFFPSFSLDA